MSLSLSRSLCSRRRVLCPVHQQLRVSVRIGEALALPPLSFFCSLRLVLGLLLSFASSFRFVSPAFPSRFHDRRRSSSLWRRGGRQPSPPPRATFDSGGRCLFKLESRRVSRIRPSFAVLPIRPTRWKSYEIEIKGEAGKKGNAAMAMMVERARAYFFLWGVLYCY